jgi:hypothetical protein
MSAIELRDIHFISVGFCVVPMRQAFTVSSLTNGGLGVADFNQKRRSESVPPKPKFWHAFHASGRQLENRRDKTKSMTSLVTGLCGENRYQ